MRWFCAVLAASLAGQAAVADLVHTSGPLVGVPVVPLGPVGPFVPGPDWSEADLHEGSSCFSGLHARRGMCISVTRCASARDDLAADRHPELCSFSGREPVVCCPCPGARDVTEQRISTASEEAILFPQHPDFVDRRQQQDADTASCAEALGFFRPSYHHHHHKPYPHEKPSGGRPPKPPTSYPGTDPSYPELGPPTPPGKPPPSPGYPYPPPPGYPYPPQQPTGPQYPGGSKPPQGGYPGGSEQGAGGPYPEYPEEPIRPPQRPTRPPVKPTRPPPDQESAGGYPGYPQFPEEPQQPPVKPTLPPPPYPDGVSPPDYGSNGQSGGSWPPPSTEYPGYPGERPVTNPAQPLPPYPVTHPGGIIPLPEELPSKPLPVHPPGPSGPPEPYPPVTAHPHPSVPISPSGPASGSRPPPYVSPPDDYFNAVPPVPDVAGAPDDTPVTTAPRDSAEATTPPSVIQPEVSSELPLNALAASEEAQPGDTTSAPRSEAAATAATTSLVSEGSATSPPAPGPADLSADATNPPATEAPLTSNQANSTVLAAADGVEGTNPSAALPEREEGADATTPTAVESSPETTTAVPASL